MAIGLDKDKIVCVVSKELKAKLELMAKDEDRSLSNYVNRILEDFVKNNNK